MKLLPAKLERKLLMNNEATGTAIKNGVEEPDHWPVVKLFTPYHSATWLLTELDPDRDRAFGLCDLGLGEPELGYVSLSELRSSGVQIERDWFWEADGPLSAYADRARELRRIPDRSKPAGEPAPSRPDEAGTFTPDFLNG